MGQEDVKQHTAVSFIHGTFLIEAIEQYIRTSQLVMRSTDYYNGNTKNDERYRLKTMTTVYSRPIALYIIAPVWWFAVISR